MKGKRVHFIALEASKNEIQRRIWFSLYANEFYADESRQRLNRPLNFPDFRLGLFKPILKKYDSAVLAKLKKFERLKIHYGGFQFTIDDLTKRVIGVADETDLVIVDHAHYFDIDSERNENQGLKAIAKTARRLTQELHKPIMLVAHLRKRDRMNFDLVPGAEEFHGSSDLSKICTCAILLAGGEMIGPTKVETYIRVDKNRLDSSIRNYIAKTIYDFKRGDFLDKFAIGRLSKNKKEFVELQADDKAWPYWLERPEPQQVEIPF
jgi:hypothetical protein